MLLVGKVLPIFIAASLVVTTILGLHISYQAAQLAGNDWVWYTELGNLVLFFLLVFLAIGVVIAAEVGIATAFRYRNQRFLNKSGYSIQWTFENSILTRSEPVVKYRGLFNPVITPKKDIIEVNLDDVRFLSWEVDIFNEYDKPRLVFWDADPTLEMTIFGFIPTNKEAQRIAELDADDFADTAGNIKLSLYQFLEARKLAGLFDNNVDLISGEPLIDELPPLQDGLELYPDGTMVQKPKMGKEKDDMS